MPDGLLQLINRAFAVESFFLAGDRLTDEELRARMAGGTFLTAEVQGALAGCVYVEVRGERGYIGLLAVDPDRQGQGMATRLMDQAEDYCRAAGCRFAELTVVNLRTELPPFYRKRGYAETGTLPFPDERRVKQPCHLIAMSKPLLQAL